MSTLSKFLMDAKKRYLNVVRTGGGRSWTVVMGNEAGDLDSIASSLAYAWFLATVKHERVVSLIQTPRADLPLRPENIHAFALAGLTANQRELLCIDDDELDTRTPFPSDRFVLVDHNHLLSRFEQNNPFVRVVGVLDHHEDEGLYQDTAVPREIVVPTGSAASVVTRYISSQIAEGKAKLPAEIATLLFCAILIDTNGLKPGGKAEQLDYDAAAYLLPRSTIASTSSVDTLTPGDIGAHEAVQALSSELLTKKADVSHLSSLDLLRRDYKQYTWSTPTEKSVTIGLSTVPVGLKAWLARADGTTEFWDAADAFMQDRQIDALGVLTTFRGEKDGKHKRQIVLMLRPDKIDAEMEERLWAGVEGAKVLDLEARPLSKYTRGDEGHDEEDVSAKNLKARVYKQGNAKATRKVVAPLLKSIFEGEKAET